MNQQIVNPRTGEFMLDKGFVLSGMTQDSDLITHFGKERLIIRDFKNGYSHYMIHNLKLDDLYFILTVRFFKGRITRIEFVLQLLPYDGNAGWDSFDREEEIRKGKFMEQWMAKQIGREAKAHDWGEMGLSYDFHNLSYSCFISYRSDPEDR